MALSSAYDVVDGGLLPDHAIDGPEPEPDNGHEEDAEGRDGVQEVLGAEGALGARGVRQQQQPERPDQEHQHGSEQHPHADYLAPGRWGAPERPQDPLGAVLIP